MPALVLQIINAATSLIIFLFVGYYFYKLQIRDKQLDSKENRLNQQLTSTAETALKLENQLFAEAEAETKRIVSESGDVSQHLKAQIETAMQNLAVELQRQASTVSEHLQAVHSTELKNLSTKSLSEFSTVSSAFKSDLEKAALAYREQLLPQLQKNISDYQKARFAQIDQAVAAIVQKAARQILNRAIPLEDHENLVIESLESAKKSGLLSS